MRRFTLPALLAAGASLVLAAPAGSHPGHGPVTIAIGSFKYAPTDVTVYTGDQVLWTWNGPDTNHSVTADAGSAEQFDSDAGKSPDQVGHPVNDGFAYQFNHAGTFAFHCKVHSFMHGTVTVNASPAPVDPNAGPPKLTKLRATPSRLCDRRSRHCRHDGTLLTFTVSEPADLNATIHPLKGGAASARVLKEVDFGAPPGTSRKRIPFGRLKPGRYRIQLVAVDRASGQASPATGVDVEVRR